MLEVKVGDEVRVFDVNGRRAGQPEGGWPGVVASVGRKYFTVDYDGQHGGRVHEFSLIDGLRANDVYGHRHVRTAEQVEAARRRRVALALLVAHWVDIQRADRLTLEQLEALAEVAKTFTFKEG